MLSGMLRRKVLGFSTDPPDVAQWHDPPPACSIMLKVSVVDSSFLSARFARAAVEQKRTKASDLKCAKNTGRRTIFRINARRNKITLKCAKHVLSFLNPVFDSKYSSEIALGPQRSARNGSYVLVYSNKKVSTICRFLDIKNVDVQKLVRFGAWQKCALLLL